MHPVADKIKMTAFEGEMEILGKARLVSFKDELKDEQFGEPSSLTITGLTMAEAWDLLSRAHGPVVVASAKTETKTETKVEQPKAATPAKPAEKPKVIEAKAEVKKVEPKPEPKPEPEEQPETDDVDDDLGDDDVSSANPDVAAMAKHEKLRPVIEYLISVGVKTAGEIVAVAIKHKDEVPAFKAVAEKGDFEKRIERSAAIVLSGNAA